MGFDLGEPSVCETAVIDNPRDEGDPSPIARGQCDALAADAPRYGCSGAGECDQPLLQCNPSAGVDGDGHKCCSDDPSTLSGEIPDYEGSEGSAARPLFSGQRNGASTSGVCVRTADVTGGLTGAAAGCPIPCNPQWGELDIDFVCGAGRVCCQTVQMTERDCVFDERQGRWRAVTGRDIAVPSPSGNVITNWSPDSHATHQDPGGQQCAEFARVDGNDTSDPDFLQCIAALTTASQRGFCTEPADCCVSPNYVDVCERMNR